MISDNCDKTDKATDIDDNDDNHEFAQPILRVQTSWFTVTCERPGVISRGRCWICIHEAWMYTSESFLGLLREMITGWKHDKNLWG